NILLAEVDDPEERRILLTDFGIARTLDEVSGLTGTNMTVGTVGYTAPEQLMGLAVDGRADQYALAATAYHLFTGFPLFPATNAAVLINHHLNTQPPALGTTRPGLAALDRVLAAALTKDPAYRFASCGEFARTLAAQVPKQPNPYMPASTTTRDVDNYVMPAVPPASGGGHLPPPLPPAPYLNVSAPPGPPVWNRPGWQAPPTRRGRGVPPAVQWAIGIVAILAIIGSAWFVVSRYTAGSSDKAGTTDVTTTESTFETTTDTTTSTRTTTPRRLVTVTVVDTCDEGGSCGVRQRSAPRKTAPNLVPDLLTDGTSVAAVCRTTGDVMSSEGHGSSSVWYRLKNGAYVNVVYFNLEGTDDPPSC
ncbi:MAG: serine/threonine protein kinase, bacterial, partial [Mycobacterium sp.]|nr:serine/threonine protein kinase, bacterial [Mycobacterium sp.]